jgi:hypothetical protein
MPTSPQDLARFDAAAVRDAGVRRVQRTTRWLLAGAIGLTGAIAGVTAQQTRPASASGAGERGAATAGSASNSYGDDSGSTYYDDDGYSGSVQPPAQAPQSAPLSTAPSTSSGAS